MCSDKCTSSAFSITPRALFASGFEYLLLGLSWLFLLQYMGAEGEQGRQIPASSLVKLSCPALHHVTSIGHVPNCESSSMRFMGCVFESLLLGFSAMADTPLAPFGNGKA
jgi:hypothetical protein